jgi:hypothetical protein
MNCRVATSDGTCVYQWDPETKQETMQWILRTAHFHVQISADKIIAPRTTFCCWTPTQVDPMHLPFSLDLACSGRFFFRQPDLMVLKSSRAISRVNVELKTNVTEISSVSIIRVDVVNDHMSLIFILVCQTMPLHIGVLCSRRAESNCVTDHPSDSNLSPCCLTW